MRRAEEFIPVTRPSFLEFDQVEVAIRETWESGRLTSGKHLEAFEDAVRTKLNVRHAVAVSSCTSGLILTIRAMELQGEVIVPSFTFAATVHALVWNGCTPVFADCEEGTYTLNPDHTESLITRHTSAIMPVYTYGLPPRLDEFEIMARNYGLKLLCDAAQGLGAQYKGRWGGGFGDAEVFSLSPTKVVSAIEGGLVTTNCDEIARRVRVLRHYGQAEDGCDMEFIGLNARFNEIYAIAGLQHFRRVEELVQRRRELIGRYQVRLNSLPGISFQDVTEGSKSTGNYMVIFVSETKAGLNRDQLHEALKSKGIQTKKYFSPPVHQQTAYKKYQTQHLPVTERAAREVLALPLYSHMDIGTLDYVCDQIESIIERQA